ncbi:response regulator [Flavisolibacter nicotianae]|uniref:response regulator n=1 Tax=Flavisolibacter nicotianae TaxID=2364882 RepID=UPI000EB1503B|nr:response regulator [Flavisolibacter nicotianae]
MDILLVDDDALDRELFIEAINLVGKGHHVKEAENGEEAISVLTSSVFLPQLIILDLNMPVKDGRATLQELRAHKKFKRIPVCIMSTSAASFDILTAYENGANLFLVKPLDFNLLIEMLSSLLTLFGKHVTLPNLED